MEVVMLLEVPVPLKIMSTLVRCLENELVPEENKNIDAAERYRK